jgi:hypothetical protein
METHVEEEENRDCQSKVANASLRKAVLFAAQKPARHKKAKGLI